VNDETGTLLLGLSQSYENKVLEEMERQIDIVEPFKDTSDKLAIQGGPEVRAVPFYFGMW
jgi:hypothetical protein